MTARWKLALVTMGGAGLSPVAPGTVGSAVTALLLLLAYYAGGEAGLWAGVCGGLVVGSALCVMLGGWADAYFGKKDPQACVLDEVAGVCLTMLGQPWWGGREEWVIIGAFVAFRVFDVIKIWPAKRLEKLPSGWGVLMDDLAAAVYANVVLQVVLRTVG